MALEDVTPWVSLLAAVLSIGYIAVDYWLLNPGGSGGDVGGGGAEGSPARSRPSLGGFVDRHQNLLTVFAVALVVAVVAHVELQTDPVLVWSVFAVVVLTVAFEEASGSDDGDGVEKAARLFENTDAFDDGVLGNVPTDVVEELADDEETGEAASETTERADDEEAGEATGLAADETTDETSAAAGDAENPDERAPAVETDGDG
jgi:hypothetical protein